ncbi:hypothetical protein WJX72_000209 [[Myrmecia] bisecta]|uniref:Uncharacterized protein n=1 Tax=[Myrmecia] bisecta TaxID=41462 RepID=A0AAW1PP97_9CHLO
MEAFETQPDNPYLLETAMGAITGLLTNIDRQGAASMAFHGDPALMRHDPYSGDYGIGFFGHAQLSGAYITHGHNPRRLVLAKSVGPDSN